MWVWLRAASVLASRSKRAMRSGSLASAAGSTFNANSSGTATGHFGGSIDTDEPSRWADAFLHLRKAQPSAATDVEHDLSGGQLEKVHSLVPARP